jgi:hypothetical protein
MNYVQKANIYESHIPPSEHFRLNNIDSLLLTFWTQIQFPKRCVFWFVEIRTMDKVQKLSSNECYTPSSESL